MERRVILPRWVTDRFSRKEEKTRADQMSDVVNLMRKFRAERRKDVPVRTNVKPHSYTRKVFDRETARRRGKRARMARRGQSVHNFRIHR